MLGEYAQFWKDPRNGYWLKEVYASSFGPTQDFELSVLELGERYWVSSDAGAMLDAAVDSMPLDFVLTDDTIPCDWGFAWFEDVRSMLDAEIIASNGLRIHAMSWGLAMVRGENSDELSHLALPEGFERVSGHIPCISFSWYVWPDESDHLIPVGRSDWPIGHRLDVELVNPRVQRTEEGDEAYRQSAIEDRRTAATLWLLLTQPRIFELEDAPIDRATRRRHERSSSTPLPPVRVVKLHQAHRPQETQEASGRHVTVRFPVKGFWRLAPVGPRSIPLAERERRPVFVPPHIRGPEGAPFVVRPKVTVV